MMKEEVMGIVKKLLKCIFWIIIIIVASAIGAYLASLTFPKLRTEGRLPYTILGTCIGIFFSWFINHSKNKKE